MKKIYDVVIIGAGPAGVFAAVELTKDLPKAKSPSILLVEQGQDISCRKRDSLMAGWGGSGAYSDGKLILSTEVGGWLSEYMPHKELTALIDYVDGLYTEFGGAAERYGDKPAKTAPIKRAATMAELTLLPVVVRHLGTDICLTVLKNLRKYLDKKIDVITDIAVEEILLKDHQATGVRLADGREIHAGTVIAAPGRAGAKWLAAEAARLGLTVGINPVDLGVRVEVPAPVMEPLTNDLYEAKLLYRSKQFEDMVRTFCVNPYGEVTTERYQGNIITVNGHSYADRRTANTNFALLVSTTFTTPFKEPIAYGEYIARLANLLGEGIIVQRLGDLMRGRRSTADRIARSTVRPTLPSATPGDLSFVLPYRYISDILEMLAAMDKIAPGVNSRNTLLYGVEVKFYSQRLKLDGGMRTEVKNLYAIGDGAGITRGLIQASAAGVIAARAITGNT
ncbi:MAG: FAD-binding protein [Actinomycetota bacterium]